MLTVHIFHPTIGEHDYTVHLAYCLWDFETTATVRVRTKARGFEVLESALEEHWTRLAQAAGVDQVPHLVLTNGAGEQLLQRDDMLLQAEWLREFCVGIEIVAAVPVAAAAAVAAPQEGRAG